MYYCTHGHHKSIRNMCYSGCNNHKIIFETELWKIERPTVLLRTATTHTHTPIILYDGKEEFGRTLGEAKKIKCWPRTWKPLNPCPDLPVWVFFLFCLHPCSWEVAFFLYILRFFFCGFACKRTKSNTIKILISCEATEKMAKIVKQLSIVHRLVKRYVYRIQCHIWQFYSIQKTWVMKIGWMPVCMCMFLL